MTNMTPTEYLSLSADDQRKFFCESVGISFILADCGCGNGEDCLYPTNTMPNLTLDFLFEWAEKAEIDFSVRRFMNLEYKASVYNGIVSWFSINKSPTVAFQLAILEYKGKLITE